MGANATSRRVSSLIVVDQVSILPPAAGAKTVLALVRSPGSSVLNPCPAGTVQVGAVSVLEPSTTHTNGLHPSTFCWRTASLASSMARLLWTNPTARAPTSRTSTMPRPIRKTPLMLELAVIGVAAFGIWSGMFSAARL